MKPIGHLILLAWCCVGSGLFIFFLALYERRRGRMRPRGLAIGALLLLAGVTVAAQTEGLHFLRSGLFHIHDQFHYVMASKYYPEIGYDHLYEATFLAAEESGTPLRVNSIREMTYYQLIPAERVRQEAPRFTDPFTESRWKEFKADVAFFIDKFSSVPNPSNSWERLFSDRGFSGTPTWTMLASQISNRINIDGTTLWLVAQLDLFLLALSFLLIARTFGLWGLGVSLLVWGCSYLTYYYVVGGSFLRQDWYLALVAAACAASTRRAGLAGAMVGYATAVRLFPGVIAIVVGGAWLVEVLRSRRLDLPQFRFLAGFGLALAVLLGTSALQYGPESWLSLSEKISTHTTQQYRVRSIGLDYLFTYTGETTLASASQEIRKLGWDGYNTLKLDRLERSKPWLIAVQILFAAAVGAVLVLRRLDLMGAMVLGCVMIPVLLSPSAYYYAYLILPLLLFCRDWPRSYAVVGILWLILQALLGHVLEGLRVHNHFLQFMLSLSAVGFCVYLLAVSWWSSDRAPPPGRFGSEAPSSGSRNPGALAIPSEASRGVTAVD